jgi:uncharacterized phage protein (TIGR02218 family)
LTADYDLVEPLRLQVPLRLSALLRVQVYKTNILLEETSLVFDGLVSSPSVEGRTITVKCQEWGQVMAGRLPQFYIQPNCNYRVFDARTCKLSTAAFQVSVTVTAKSGRSLTVSGAGLSGKPRDYFAQGWIEVGSGVDRQVLFILSNSDASGNKIVASTNATLNQAVPASATIVPGCDGLRRTCIQKFNNLNNFGGHITPKENLVLEAIKIESGAISKK